jgi:hypothetical protein
MIDRIQPSSLTSPISHVELPQRWKRREPLAEWNPADTVSDAELLNRVILAKALVVHSSGKPVMLRTIKEEFEITTGVAEDILRAAGFFKNRGLGSRVEPKQ